MSDLESAWLEFCSKPDQTYNLYILQFEKYPKSVPLKDFFEKSAKKGPVKGLFRRRRSILYIYYKNL